jgi:hypothetical protein
MIGLLGEAIGYRVAVRLPEVIKLEQPMTMPDVQTHSLVSLATSYVNLILTS